MIGKVHEKRREPNLYLRPPGNENQRVSIPVPFSESFPARGKKKEFVITSDFSLSTKVSFSFLRLPPIPFSLCLLNPNGSPPSSPPSFSFPLFFPLIRAEWGKGGTIEMFEPFIRLYLLCSKRGRGRRGVSLEWGDLGIGRRGQIGPKFRRRGGKGWRKATISELCKN